MKHEGKSVTRKSLFCLCALTAALSFGCNNDKQEDKTNTDNDKFVFATYRSHTAVTNHFEMNSQAGCALDSDCSKGMFCFHGLCTNECSDQNPCAVGNCSEHGRCLLAKETSGLVRDLRDLKDDLNEAKNSGIVEHIPGAEVLYTPDNKVFVNVGASYAVVTLTTLKDYGTISYTVSKPINETISNLMKSDPKSDSKNGLTVYSFMIPAKESSLGDQGTQEHVVLDTSVGSYEIALTPHKPTTGLYDGMVIANQFGGVGLPIRFVVETKPATIKSFNDIKEMSIYLPSSGADLFSPEVVNDADKTTWSKIVMKSQTTNCMQEGKCWVASYSTNDFTFPQSSLLNADQKVNRSIRIEIAGYDENTMMFDGSIRDILAGVYREVDNKGKNQWAKATLEGLFTATRKNSFVKENYEIVEHQRPAKEELRDTEAVAADICTDADIAALMANAGDECSAIETLDGYKAADNARACLLTATNTILASDDLVSKIIEALITKSPENLEPVAGFDTLQDFMGNCALDDGICAENHTFVCAVDLLGRSYLTSDETDKVEILENWHQLLRESYLGRQYSAWQNDVEVRRKWLENADAPTFLAAQLENINTNMLNEWERKVFSAHRNVLSKQFNQTSLEVLTRIDNDSTIVSRRDLILGEFADGWSGVSDSMSLGLRRYDTLYQGTEQRKAKAAEMRPYLFDLYYSGLVETAINRNTNNGSLNGSYGKNLYENVRRLRSLDQSFDDLVFMRDAEVVTSTSLDPESNNLKVLSDRKKLAKETVAAAQSRRDKVFDDYDKKTIDKAQINATLRNTIDSLQTELVSLCGLPRGCTEANTEECAPRTEPGFCGFSLPADSMVPAAFEKDIDPSNISSADVNQYYSSKSYEITGDQLMKLTESDIRAMSEINRNELLGLTDEDFADKEQEEINSIVDASIAAYLAHQNAQLKYTMTDFYSLTNSGEAAEAILAYRRALKDVDIAQADYIALNNKVAIAASVCNSYADNIAQWDESRKQLLKTIQQNIDVINSHYDNITEAERSKIEKDLELLQAQYDKQYNYVNTTWDNLATTYKDEQNDRIETIQHLTNACSALEFSVGTVDRVKEVAQALWEEPKDSDAMFGFSTFGAAKAVVTGIANVACVAMEAVSLGLEVKANNRQAAMDKAANKYEYDSTYNELHNDLDQQKLELDLQESLAVFKKMDTQDECETVSKTECHSIVTCDCSKTKDLDDIYSEVSCPEDKCDLKEEWYVMGLDQWILSEQNAIDTLDEVNDTMRELFEVNDAYLRDLQDLEFRRSEYLQLAQDLLVKRENVLKAQIDADTALKHYYSVVQRAMMLKSQYNAASDRLAVINNLYSAPATIFSFASDLEIVESKIELAKERIYDYLSATEYLAVRPFVDLRRATYLARSTNDLDKIIDQIDTVVSKCGAGTPSVATVEVSAREMMGITKDFANMTQAERFQSVIAKGNIPINSLTRYTVDSNVRDLVKRSSDLRSGTFAVNISKDMNLAATCDAKIDTIAVQIVGKDIIKEGAGSIVHPTITVFYDGQTQLVSCQPNITTLVETIGPKTSYGKYSSFVVESTKISPNAGINEYGEANVALAGKPFASSYTVLIDTQISENSKIDWDKVEDIMLQVRYTYHDLLPNSSECVGL